MTSSQTDKPRGVRARYSAREIYIPKGVAEIETRKTKFEKLNRAVTALGGWITSVPGNPEIVVEMLPNSPLEGRLRDAGYSLRPADPAQSERIIPGSVVERLEPSSSGVLIAASENSTKPIITRSHSGICRVRRYRFTIA
jgi:hypothetical protein